MTKLKTLALVSAVALGAITTSGASAAIVTNGGFESGLAGWTPYQIGGVSPGSGVQVVTTGGPGATTSYGDVVPSFEGTKAAYFVDDLSVQGITQLVSLVGGQNYTLNFALFATRSGASNPFGFVLTESVGLDLLGAQANNIFGNDVPVGVWSTYSFNFTAPVTSSAYLLKFNFASSFMPAKDVLLDAVSITQPGAVPEPATWAMMIGGLGLVGLQMRRRKASVSFA